MKPFKEMKVPQLAGFASIPGKWVVVADDDEKLKTYLHDDLEWYDGGVYYQGTTRVDGTVSYSTSACFDYESTAERFRAAYYIKHKKSMGTNSQPTTKNVNSEEFKF